MTIRAALQSMSPDCRPKSAMELSETANGQCEDCIRPWHLVDTVPLEPEEFRWAVKSANGMSR